MQTDLRGWREHEFRLLQNILQSEIKAEIKNTISAERQEHIKSDYNALEKLDSITARNNPKTGI